MANHGPSILDYYKADPSRHGSLWTPAADCAKEKTNVPCLLHIPLVLFEFIQKEGCPLMPHAVLTLVLKFVKKAQALANTWQLVMISTG